MRDKEIMLTSAQRLAGIGSWVFEIQADRLTLSEETYRLLGLGPEDCDGRLESFLAWVHLEDQQELRDVVTRALEGESPFSYRYRIIGADGRERLIQGDGETQHDEEGTPLRLIGTVVDITQRERERQAMHESEQRFRSLVALSSDWYWQQDEELRFTEFHPRAPRHDTVIGKRRWEVAHCTPVRTTWEEHQALLAARLPFRDLEIRHDYGPVPRHVYVSGEPYYDAHGRFLGYRGTARDVTERKAAEERMRQLNAGLRMAMRLGRIGVWWLDAADRTLRWWDGGRVVYAPDGGVASGLEALLERVEPGQRAGLRDAMQRCMREGHAFDVEVCLQAGLHPLMWVRIIGEPHRDVDGAIRQVQGTVQDVTERRLATDRARELGACAAAATDSGSVAFLTVNREWTITFLNPEAEQLLLRPRPELVGRNLWEEFPRIRGTRFEREYRRAMAEGETVEFQEFLERQGVWVHVRACPSLRGLAIYFRDVTNRHGVQKALADSQEELRHLFENTIDGVLYTGNDDEVVSLNPAACAMLGRSHQEIRGRPLAALLGTGERGFAALREERAMTGRASGQLAFTRGDGSEFAAEVSTAEYTAADGSVRAFVVFRDISHRLRHEQEILQLNAELGARVQQRTAELEAANADLKAFAHALAHDLQSPLACIDGFSRMLESVLPQPAPERALHYLSRIRAASCKTSEYSQGLLGLARVAQATLHPQRVDLGAIATDILKELAERDRERDVAWQVQDGLVAHGDATLLRMVLDNLLGNAWKFTRKRRPGRIEFTLEAGAAGELVYRLRDNGAGFDMAYAHRLFGNFQRLHAQDEFPGTGVGLANVQRVITRHGGRIWAEGTPGEGASFYFTLSSPSAGVSENEKRAP